MLRITSVSADTAVSFYISIDFVGHVAISIYVLETVWVFSPWSSKGLG